MGSRRIGRKRLYALNKAGESLTSTAGAGIEGNIGSQSRVREQSLIVTEFTIDLASSEGAAFAFSSAFGGAQDPRVLGLSASTATSASTSIWEGNSAANIALINGTASAADGLGILAAGEMICVEEPRGGIANIGLVVATGSLAGGQKVDSDATVATLVASSTTHDLGQFDTFTLNDVDVDNHYLYLVTSGSVGATGANSAYTQGKFVIRLFGINVFDDV